MVVSLGQFKLGWEDVGGQEKGDFFEALAFVNFNDQLSYMDCLLGWGWEELWWFAMMRPLIICLIPLLQLAASKLKSSIFKRITARPTKVSEAAELTGQVLDNNNGRPEAAESASKAVTGEGLGQEQSYKVASEGLGPEQKQEKQEPWRTVLDPYDDLHIGTEVRHGQRGHGLIIAFDPSNERGKPYEVKFDAGDSHQYSSASAMKLQVLIEQGKENEEDKVSPNLSVRARRCSVTGQLTRQVSMGGSIKSIRSIEDIKQQSWCRWFLMPPPHVQASTLRLLRTVYLPTLANSLHVLRCEEYGTSTYLRSAPHITCGTLSHTLMVACASVSLLCFSLGLPLCYGAIPFEWP